MPASCKYPCRKCRKSVRGKSLFCNVCSCWIHLKCTNLNLQEYRELEDESDEIPWCCHECILDSVPFSSVSNTELIDLTNLDSESCNEAILLDADYLNDLFFSIDESDESGDDDGDNDCEFGMKISNQYLNSHNVKELKFGDSNNLSGFMTLNINIRSIANFKNYSKLEAMVSSFDCKPHIIGINETWIKPETSGHYKSLEGYHFLSNNRTQGTGGGVGLYIRNDVSYFPRPDLTVMREKIFESIFVDIKLEGKFLTCGTIYRSPLLDGSSNSEFRQNLDNLLRKINKNNYSYIMGDFNYNLLLESDSDIDSFIDIMHSFSYYSLINRPTHITKNSATCIDHIWTNVCDKRINCAIISECPADHLPVVQCSLLEKHISNQFESLLRKFNEKNMENFLYKMNDTDMSHLLDIQDPDTCFNKFFEIFSAIFETCFPVEKSSRKNCKYKPWYDQELKKLNIAKQKLYKKLIKTNDTGSTSNCRMKYNKCRNLYDRCLLARKSQYYKLQFIRHKNNIRAVWKSINELLGRTKNKNCTSSVEMVSDRDMANKFNMHFSGVAQKLIDQLPQSSNKSYLGRNCSANSIYLKPTFPMEIKRIIRDLKPKSSFGFDGIPSKIIKLLPVHFIDVLTHICNLSMTNGKYVDHFKMAKVIPLFKKGDKSDFSNYRPVSLLPSFSKILEKVLYSRFSNFFNQNDTLYSQQFGFRRKHSTAMATNIAVHKITQGFELNEYTMGIFLDISKAFDTIDHSILVDKLSHYGIRGIALEWVESYLQERKQIVQFNNSLSNNVCAIRHGVPQGSVLGPLFFLIYINDLPNCLESAEPIMFADDTKLFLSDKNLNNLIIRANKDLDNINKWMICNKLSMNVDKTKYMLFHPQKAKSIPIEESLLLNDRVVERVREHTFLGLIFDENLSWKSQIKNVLKKIRINLGVTARIKNCANRSTLIAIFQSLILSHIRYCGSVWLHGNVTLINQLQSTCNQFLRLIFGKRRDENVDHLYKSLRILKVEDISYFEMASLIFDFHDEELPICYDAIFQKCSSITRTEKKLALPGMSKTVSQQALSYSGPKFWNKLPNYLKKIDTKEIFQKRLKSYLISKY